MIRISFWTCAFLVVLRICIGWHFCYEGVTKVKSAYQGKASTDKVFTSESYFRESEGPFGRLVKRQMVDPDQDIIDRLTLGPAEGDVSDPAMFLMGSVVAPLVANLPASRFPVSMAKEWDDYFKRFAAQYRLDDAQKQKAEPVFEALKAKFVNWVKGISDQKDEKGNPKPIMLTVKRKAPGPNAAGDYEEEVTVAERAAELKKKSEEVRAAYSRMEHMGKDVDAAALRSLKSDVATIRTELRKETDDQTQGMKDALVKELGPRVAAYAKQANNATEAATLEAMLKPMAEGNNPLSALWDQYAAYVKDFAPDITDAQKTEIDEALRAAKIRFDRWLADEDPYNKAPRPNKVVAEWKQQYADAQARKAAAERLTPPSPKDKPPQDPKTSPARILFWLPAYMPDVIAVVRSDADAEIKQLTTKMQVELKGQSDAMRAQIGTRLLGEERAKGFVATTDERYLWLFPKEWTLIDYFDWSTRWFLLIVGALLIVGLFTRLSCFASAGFLLLTILTQPPVPWLPASPMNEGSYLFVNKNVIEMVALLVLMTTRTGHWFGLDAIVSWIFKRRPRRY